MMTKETKNNFYSYQRDLVIGINLLLTFLMAFFSVLRFVEGAMSVAAINTFTGIFFLCNLLIYKISKNIEFSAQATLFMLMINSFVSFAIGSGEQLTFLGIILMPMIFFIVKEHVRIQVGYYIALVSLVVLHLTGLYSLNISINSLIPILLVSMGTSFVSYYQYILIERYRSSSKEALNVSMKQQEITKAEKNKLNSILQSIGEGVVVIDKNKIIISSNKTFEHISGFNKKDLLGNSYKSLLRFYDQKLGRESTSHIENILKGGLLNRVNDLFFITKDEERVPVDITLSPMHRGGEGVTGCVVVLRDATIQREIMQKKFEFLTLASHQLRTPLTNIKWNLQIIKKDGYKGMNKKQTEKMKKMYSSTERMLKLISELVNVNDIDNKTAVVEVDREETDINEIINMVLDELESLIINNEIKITYDEEILKGIKKNIDKHKITSVFTSIIKNAIEYSDMEDEIIIGYIKDKDCFSVKDNGIGIPEKDKEFIFQKFFRASNAVRKVPNGNGIGLYIAKKIIDTHGGKINFKSKEGEGTTFYITLNK